MSHTPGKLQLWTSNSWRRIGTHGTQLSGLVCEPITQKDGHPDLHFRNGGPEGPDARRLIAAWNACEGLDTERLENAVPIKAEIEQAREGRLMWARIADDKQRLVEQLAADFETVLIHLRAATHALRSYQHGNASPDLAQEIADDADALLAKFPIEEKEGV